MPIPDFQTVMLPLLKLLSNQKELKLSEMVDIMSKEFNLTEEERNEWLPSKVQKTMYNRVAWAKQYLKNAELIDAPIRNCFKITPKGLDLLGKNPSKIDVKLLRGLDTEDCIIETAIRDSSQEIEETKETPEEMFERAKLLYSESLETEILKNLKKVHPIRFERMVLDLMEKMKYGIGSMTPKSHDGGIDGIIDEDELGLEKIYLQAKRYSDNKVNEKEMQNFVGALGCSAVRKGVFITTSFFDERAKEKARNAQGIVVRLIDGAELTRLMIKYNVGVQAKETIEIKRIDIDFFEDEE